MNPATERCEFHQCLHGYSDGHRLLASSTKLPETAQAALLVLTDVPDGVSPTGFVPFLTGHAVPDTSFFALSRTWPAPEMPRPGCVWTHTILIPLSELGSLQDLGGIAALLRRPASPLVDIERYRNSLIGDVSKPGALSRTVERGVASIVAALYGVPSGTVRVDGPDQHHFESIVLQLWTQQWPKMRRAFSFRTAATDPNARTSTRFDLVHGLADSAARVVVAINSNEHVVVPDPDAGSVQMLTEDLFAPGSLRRFLWAFGADSGTRRACLPLVCVYRWICSKSSSRDEAAGVLVDFAAAFQEPSAAGRLKKALLGWTESDIGIEQPNLDNRINALEWLCANDRIEDFGIEEAELRRRVSEFWDSDTSRAIQLARKLAGGPLNGSTQTVLDVLFSQMDASTLLDVAKDAKGMVYTLVSRQPSLATNSVLWGLSHEAQEEAIRALGRIEAMSDTVVTDIARAMLSARNERTPELLDDSLAARLVGPVIDASEAWDVLPDAWFDPWLRHIHAHPSAIDDWLRGTQSLSAIQAAIALPTTRPSWAAIEHIDYAVLARTIRSLRALSGARATDALVWLFVAGQDRRSMEAIELSLLAFEPIYWAANRSSLTPMSQHRLDRCLPDIGTWHNWDLCLRLASKVAIGFVEEGWPEGRLVSTATTSEAIARIIRQALRIKGGKKWLRHFADVAPHLPGISTEQLDVIHRMM